MAKKESKKQDKKEEKIEREYVIPLREKCRPVPRYKKTPKAIKAIKEFLARHMKIRDRDLKKIKIDSYLNEQIWMRGIKNPIHKIKVRVVKEGDLVRVYSVDLPKKLNFKKLRDEKLEIKAKEDVEKQKTLMEKAKETMQGKKSPEEEKKEPEKGKEEKTEEETKEKEEKPEEKPEERTEEEKKEEVEKQEAVKEVKQKEAKEAKRKEKHTTKTKTPKELKNVQKGYNKGSRGH